MGGDTRRKITDTEKEMYIMNIRIVIRTSDFDVIQILFKNIANFGKLVSTADFKALRPFEEATPYNSGNFGLLH